MKTLALTKVLILAVLGVILSGCADTPNPIASATKALPADKAETMAFALHNSYVVAAERALAIAQKPETPDDVKRKLIAAHEAASPIAKSLKAAADEVRTVREAFNAGTTPEEKVLIALEQLNRLLTVENINKLNALEEAAGGGA